MKQKAVVVGLILVALLIPSPIFPRSVQAPDAAVTRVDAGLAETQNHLVAVMMGALQDLHAARRELREAGLDMHTHLVDSDAILTAELLMDLASMPAEEFAADPEGAALMPRAAIEACRESARTAREIVARGF